MPHYKLGKRSLKNLEGVHPDLVRVIKRAIQITPIDFTVIEGTRTIARQRELVKRGASKTMNSRHLTGHAVDVVPLVGGEISWAWPNYYPLAEAIKRAAKEEGVKIEWGGDWRSFKDGPHWQLPWKLYPKDQPFAAEVDNSPKYTSETEAAAKTKAVGAATSGAAGGAVVAAEPVANISTALVEQTDNISSGDIVRVVIGAGIVGLALFIAWKKLK